MELLNEKKGRSKYGPVKGGTLHADSNVKDVHLDRYNHNMHLCKIDMLSLQGLIN